MELVPNLKWVHHRWEYHNWTEISESAIFGAWDFFVGLRTQGWPEERILLIRWFQLDVSRAVWRSRSTREQTFGLWVLDTQWWQTWRWWMFYGPDSHIRPQETIVSLPQWWRVRACCKKRAMHVHRDGLRVRLRLRERFQFPRHLHSWNWQGIVGGHYAFQTRGAMQRVWLLRSLSRLQKSPGQHLPGRTVNSPDKVYLWHVWRCKEIFLNSDRLHHTDSDKYTDLLTLNSQLVRTLQKDSSGKFSTEIVVKINVAQGPQRLKRIIFGTWLQL